MALLRCDFFSHALGLSTSMTVILPQRTTTQVGLAGAATDAPPPVLHLLHGMSDDTTTRVRRTSVERYVAPLGLAVVMPQVHRSHDTDEAHAGRSWTFLSEELPAVVHDVFRVSERREDTFVAGLSTGGYGAFTWALREPGRFAAAATCRRARHRGPHDPPPATVGPADDAAAVRRRRRRRQRRRPDAPRVRGGRGGPAGDAGLVRDRGRAAGGQPPVRGGVRGRRLPIELVEGPGDHDGSSWDARIVDVLDWLPLAAP